MIATIFCALLGFGVGVAMASDTEPSSFPNTILPVIGLLIVAATLGGL